MLCLDRDTGDISHHRFFQLPQFLREGDCLVLNDSRVLPARLLGSRDTGGAVEVLLLREIAAAESTRSSIRTDTKPSAAGSGREGEVTERSGCPPTGGRSAAESTSTWECLVKPGRKARTGTRLVFGDNEMTAVVTEETNGGNRHIQFSHSGGTFLETLERLGKTPLPPYIRTSDEQVDRDRYQTVYSRVSGSAAAPTAGLHFTDDLLKTIESAGIEICYITLHIGLGTFRPVKEDEIEDHKMHSEYLIVPEETAGTVNRAKSKGGRVVAVGTTSCRTLEACAGRRGNISPFSGFTDIFIYPGYKFKCVDGLITNFHLPESTLIMLVSAFAGRENVLKAYSEAIRERYRFFSYGDAMLVM